MITSSPGLIVASMRVLERLAHADSDQQLVLGIVGDAVELLQMRRPAPPAARAGPSSKYRPYRRCCRPRARALAASRICSRGDKIRFANAERDHIRHLRHDVEEPPDSRRRHLRHALRDTFVRHTDTPLTGGRRLAAHALTAAERRSLAPILAWCRRAAKLSTDDCSTGF